MWEWIVWTGGAVHSVEDAYEQLRQTRIRNDMNTANLALKTPHWLKWTWLFSWEGAEPFVAERLGFQVSSRKRGSECWAGIAYIQYVYLGWPGLGAFPASACNSCVSRKAAWFTGRTSSYWGRARTLVFSCLIFPLACHGFFCKLIACSSSYYGMQGCPWKVSSFKLIMWSFCVSWHSLLITVGQFSSMLKQV